MITNFDNEQLPVPANRRFEGLARFLSPQKSCQKVLANERNRTVTNFNTTIANNASWERPLDIIVSDTSIDNGEGGRGKAEGFGARGKAFPLLKIINMVYSKGYEHR